jgi:hypothetical protein
LAKLTREWTCIERTLPWDVKKTDRCNKIKVDTMMISEATVANMACPRAMHATTQEERWKIQE